MPRTRTPKTTTESRDASADESDTTLDRTSSTQNRRTRKRPAQPAQEISTDRPSSRAASRSQSEAAERPASTTDSDPAERHSLAARHRHGERGTAGDAALATSLTFETPDEARDRLSSMRSNSSNSATSVRSAPSHRSVRNSRSSTELRPSADQLAQDGYGTSSAMRQGSPNRSFSTRYIDDLTSPDSTNADDVPMMPLQTRSQQADGNSLRPLTISTQNMTVQPQNVSPYSATTPLARSNSNMSPPRPTRSLPRRRASARTQNRPLLSSSNHASSSYLLRSRSTSSSNILAPSNSTANILASGHSRQNSTNGCVPPGGGFDPSYLPPSGSLTPRTPLAEIPLWLADMRSLSRRSSISSSSFMEREDLSNASRTFPTRHVRTVSTSSSSGPSSPGATRNGSTSPAVSFRRSLRGSRPRQSDENARISPSPSYFGESDALPSPSPSSIRGEMTPLDESLDPNASLSSGVIHLGTSSPSTPSVHLQQASSPAMSTRSRTLNRTGSIRGRRLTNPLNTPVSADSLGFSHDAVRTQQSDPPSAFHQARSSAQERRTRNSVDQRAGTLLERRAATAAAAGAAPCTPVNAARGSSRSSSRTSSPAHGTRASRRRSTAAEGQKSSTLEGSASGPRPGYLPPLQIPSIRLARNSGPMTADASTISSMIPERAIEEQAHDQHAAQLEPISPSAFSEMTSLTQGSTASESINSANGMPATPSSSVSTLDPLAQSIMHDASVIEAEASDVSRRTPRKNPHASRDAELAEDALGF